MHNGLSFSPLDHDMVPVVTGEEMRALDSQTIEEGHISELTLMEHAGKGVVQYMEELWGGLSGKVITILCGKGNNGGDGFVVARLLRSKRAKPRVILLTRAGELRGPAKINYRRWSKISGRRSTLIQPPEQSLKAWIHTSDLLIDALLGTGLSSSVKDPYLTAIHALNSQSRPVIAIDLPSGLHSHSGTIMGEAVRATVTITLGFPKLGLYLNQGVDCAGAVHVADIGIPASYIRSLESPMALLTTKYIQSIIPARPRSGHKGTFGHVAVVAGSVGKTGAAALSATAALRTGSGLVTVATPTSVNDILESKLLEVMTLPMPETSDRTLSQEAFPLLRTFFSTRTAGAIGPGLGTHPDTLDLIRALIPTLEIPTVLDADALNALAGQTNILSRAKASLIITPHPGEMARLLEVASSQIINADRIGFAKRFAQDHRVLVVLKGARTIIAHPDGPVAICPTGNPGMATAGSGDILTGMIASFLGQGCPAWDAACAGTFCHGLAGDFAAEALGENGMIARDLLQHIPGALHQVKPRSQEGNPPHPRIGSRKPE